MTGHAGDRMLPLSVVKIGGSLLDIEDLPSKLNWWISGEPAAVHLLLPGGGPAADLVREADRRFGLDPEAAHWLALRAMSLTGSLLAQLLPEAKLIGSLTAVRRSSRTMLIADAERILRNAPEEFGPEVLPYSWDVTSDSIAAQLAAVLGADELVLLKSCLPENAASWQEAAASGFVDRHFPLLVNAVRRVRAVNLRNSDWPSWGGELSHKRSSGPERR